MNNFFLNTFKSCAIFVLFYASLSFASTQDIKKGSMIEDLKMIKHVFDVGYAPLEWKKNYTGLNLDEELNKSIDLILSNPTLTHKDFQRIVKNFLASTKDYHVDVIFFSTETATLPFDVKGVNDRYFITWIDELKLPPSTYMIKVGDEIIEFDGRPLGDVIEELKQQGSKNSNPLTDQALAEIKLTNRLGWLGDIVPQGPVTIKVHSRSNEVPLSYQLIWDYHPELIFSPSFFLQTVESFFPNKKVSLKSPCMTMMNLTHRKMMSETQRDGTLGARKSFIPTLGPRVWMFDKIDKEKEISWYAYIYKISEEEKIGYIRIPHYIGHKEESKEFGELLNYLEQKTDALVIDQVHNGGGYASFQYELASMLTLNPLKTPKHRMKITQKDVLTAYQILDAIEKIQQGIDDEIEEGPIDYQHLLFLKAFYEFTIQEWDGQRTLTDPTHLEGCDWINPHSDYRYTKPILMLINELDFSGGDFMPAIMQDNQRAVLFGTRTSGAGGFVLQASFPNNNGIAAFSYTGSIAERPETLLKIENLGVTPDIVYSLTVDDLQNGYQGYKAAVNEAVQALIKKK
ncbi:Uncharacterized protein PRO82_000091 [Candidatus Protochlamydia amoebophila]|uniref:protease-like activity factor CPAF n=1 Tax=Candidatus Protochlamydia amoebophila TaxID=362787 RepID=UPI001BC95379|nr:protease-like activity factor CPAF [Candidatus Protochlamydia amoebophila]MBS4162814.1 Uncharacterized protein [Candidatus Protochlamydia amoebophila]